jgi:predicted O-linked N-acetylglucosamine transferase (SPINDLY family)
MTDHASGSADEFAAALAHHSAGRLDEAAAACERILASAPDHPAALHLLGVVSLQQGHHPRGVALLERAVHVDPRNHEAQMRLGQAHEQAGRRDAAVECFRRALEAAPGFWPAHERLGYACFARRDYAAAAVEFNRVVELRPEHAPAYNNLGTTLGALGRMSEAITAFERAVALDPALAEAWLNYAQSLEALLRPSEAASAFRRFIQLRPDNAAAHVRLGRVLHQMGDWRAAVACLQAALRIDAELVEARWLLPMLQIPPVYDADDAPAAARSRFEHELRSLDEWFDRGRAALAWNVVGSMQPFYLAYDETNHRDLLARYGDLCARLMAAHLRPAPAVVRSRGARARVAIVSGQFYDQSVWTAIVRGWCAALDRSRIELALFHTKRIDDAQTEVARRSCDAFIQEPGSLDAWIEALSHHAPDVIVYPDLGMDATTARLAALRLAPVQWASWGHPETTGLPTIDAFVSADAFEPGDADTHYRERLIRLPGIGCCYSRLDVPHVEVDLAALGIDERAPLLVCPGTAYKYLPRHDAILAAIARRVGRCTLVFFVDIVPELSSRHQHRMVEALRREGVPADRVRFVAHQSRPEFFGFMRRADAVLDTLGFSGFNTAMQAVQCGAPLVTMRGRYMRGRFGSGILQRMGLADAVADSESGYVEQAVRLCTDAAANRVLRRRVDERRARVFDDPEPVEALSQRLFEAR